MGFSSVMTARMYRFAVPGVGSVVVEIGDAEWSRDGLVYPAYRVTVAGAVVDWDSAADSRDDRDWSVRDGDPCDGVDAALSLLWFSVGGEHTASRPLLAEWVRRRRVTRAVLRERGR